MSMLIVSPVFNEAKHLDRTAAAIAAQVVKPDRWVIVDDGSSDDTLAIAHRWAEQLDFVTVLQADDGDEGPDRLALAREARAFNQALQHADWRRYDYIGKLDGDVELPPEWFAQLLARMEADPELGIGGGRLIEPSPGGWKMIPIPAHHVHGAVKLYRRECLEAIGGVQERLAWDTIDETYARMRGYRTLSPPDLVGRHHRAWGSADGRLRGKARHGECAWILHHPPLWTALRIFKLGRVPPYGLSGLAYFHGYVRAALRRTPRVDDPEFRRFVRRELRGRMTGRVRIAPSRALMGRR
ncbi:glycosyltransferase family 2 protein [Conexibacter woesei]|uniref:glycosyltransferase family 2 protein n=1 Tax=Conexibacter woesei TaxID=191495 RepID=UPI001E2E850F|nr:glycosyltransferase family A protein [Conexibacter woesei]